MRPSFSAYCPKNWTKILWLLKMFCGCTNFWYTIESRTNRSFAHFLCKWGQFERAKSTFKMLLVSWFLMYFLKRFRSFIAQNLGLVGQRAAKLPAVKVEGLKKKSASQPRPQPNQSASVRVLDAVESFSKFDGWSLCSPLTYRTQIFSIKTS